VNYASPEAYEWWLLVDLQCTSLEEHDRWTNRNRIYEYTQFPEVLEQIEEDLSRIKLSGH